jgi:hypothetical protein
MKTTEAFELPLSLIIPAKLNKQAAPETCGLFFPHGTSLKLGLSVNWNGETHLIHLDGAHLFKEGEIAMGHPVRGVVITDFEYRVDLASRYDASNAYDPAGALVLREGKVVLFCHKLGDQHHNDPHAVPLATGVLPGSAEEACGFTRWSIAIRDGDKTKIFRSFEAVAAK